jgi:hypothetical protein
LSLAAATIFLIHLGIAFLETLSNAGPHGSLQITAMPEGLCPNAIFEQVTGNVLYGHVFILARRRSGNFFQIIERVQHTLTRWKSRIHNALVRRDENGSMSKAAPRFPGPTLYSHVIWLVFMRQVMGSCKSSLLT